MTLAVRFWIGANSQVRHHSGRTYTANCAGIVDVPIGDAESIHSYIPGGHPDRDPSGVHRAQRLMFVGATEALRETAAQLSERPIIDQICETVAQLERDRAEWFKAFADSFERDAKVQLDAFPEIYERACRELLGRT